MLMLYAIAGISLLGLIIYSVVSLVRFLMD